MVTTLFDLGLNLIVVFVFLLAFGVSPMWTWLLLPVIVGLLFVLTLGMAMILSSLYPRFRDIGIIWGVISTALFYATPVLYPIEKVPATMRSIIGGKIGFLESATERLSPFSTSELTPLMLVSTT